MSWPSSCSVVNNLQYGIAIVAELSTQNAFFPFREELLIVVPVISLISSPSKSVKVAATHLLLLAERFLLDFRGVSQEDDISCTDHPVRIEAESIPLRLLHCIFTKGQHSLYHSYFSLLTSNKMPCVGKKYHGPLCWTSWLREHLLTNEREKATFPSHLSENQFEGRRDVAGRRSIHDGMKRDDDRQANARRRAGRVTREDGLDGGASAKKNGAQRRLGHQ
ncbi:hypothetical protein KSP40_PGU021541 [Platanthera guangdongensis]|uniref:Uncharacterized protein n=1 Tax=Platanthera guangdongensis TaxID=2320717 RepID=A0ABR2LF16_9ASPA